MAEAPIRMPEFIKTDDFGFVRVADIDVNEERRLRPIDEAHAEMLGHAMLRDGQATPIVVCREAGQSVWTLVAGAHRVRGAQIVGIEQLQAEIISDDGVVRRKREIAENLCRKGLNPVERALFVAELVDLQKIRAGMVPGQSQHQLAALARWQKALKVEAKDATATIAVAYGWTDAVADQTGFSARTIYNDLTLVRRLTPVTIDALRSVNHPLLSNASQLRALAKLEPAQQADVVAALLGRGKFEGRPAKNIAEAQARLSNRREATAEDKRWSAFFGAWNRMSLAERKGALAELAQQLPKGWALTSPEGGAE